MSDQDLKAELERLRKENEALKKGASSSIRIKVSEKGAVSIYGMGRFPVTLYKEQWLKLLDMSADIRAFIAANEARCRRALCWNSMWRNLQRHEVIGSGGEVNRLIDGRCDERLPAIHLAHVDLTGGEQCPE